MSPNRLFLRVGSAAGRGVLIGIAWALICWWLRGTALLGALENWALDGNFVLRGERSSPANVVIIAIDEETLTAINKPLLFFSPEMASVVDYVRDRGAAAIGIDFLVPRRKKTMRYLLPGGPGDAQTMGLAVGRAGNVVLPQKLQTGGEPLLPAFEWCVPSSRPWADLGFVDLAVDSDACVRMQRLRMRDGQGGVFPSLHLALLAKARERPQSWLDAEHLMLDGHGIPFEGENGIRINYVGPPGTIRTVPFLQVLEAARDRSTPEGRNVSYQDAIVLIGVTVESSKDAFPTPYSNQTIPQLLRLRASRPAELMPGVEVNANVVATLLDGAFITTPWWLATPLWLLLTGGILGGLLVRCSLEGGALLTIGHQLAWRVAALAAFSYADWQIETVAVSILGIALYGTIFAMRWRWIRRMMGMIKSEAVARALEADPARLHLRGEQRQITVLLCDIRDFTPFSERHEPQEVVRLLNAFFAVAVPAVEGEGGVVFQYIGDALLAVFGAPAPLADHAARAVRAAAEILRRVHAMNEHWKALGAEHFRVGIGVHTGVAVVGTVGSPKRLDYTAIGDTVNTAARIESATKQVHVEALASQATFLELPEEDRRRIAAAGEAQSVSVKGKAEALSVYRIA